MQMVKVITRMGVLALMAGLAGCTDKEDPTAGTTELGEVYQQIYGATDVYVEGDYVIIKTNGRPDHKSPYFQNTEWESTQYQAYNGPGTFSQNPNSIGTQRYTFKIPKDPKVATIHATTPLGPIGISLNGVPFYNQYAGPSQPLTNEVISFDQYSGHPDQMNRYHYHVEPLYLTTQKGKSALLGFLLDGFPVYGPLENGTSVQNADVDAFHGHSHPTAEYPNGIYHYHTTAAAPYINGNGFYGTAGTVTN